MTPLSAVITTFNNAGTLPRCLDSVRELADDLVVVDSHSTDSSTAIAVDHQARLIRQAFLGYGPQKQLAVDLAQHDWVLLLDADEALSAALQQEIRTLKQQGFSGPGYRFGRREWLAWREPVSRHGRWQHPWVRLTDHLRLFDRRLVRLSEHPVHAAPATSLATPLLKYPLLHWGDAPFRRRREKARRYAELSALSTTSWRAYPKLLLAPPWALLQDYILRRGCMNPWLGLMAAGHSAYASFLKYWYRLR